VKVVPESKPVARKEVMELQPFHVLLKSVPLDRFNAGKDVRAVQLLHAWEKLISSLAVVLNVQAPNDVIAVLPVHAPSKLVPLDRLRAGKEVNLQSFHAFRKLRSSSA